MIVSRAIKATPWAGFMVSKMKALTTLLVASIVAVSAVGSYTYCQRPFINIGSGCYLFSGAAKKFSWFGGAEYCAAYQANLLTIDDAAENDNIKQYLRASGWQTTSFIGGYDLGHEREWRWLSSFAQMAFTDWAPKQPDNQGGNQHCLSLSGQYDFKWEDSRCFDTKSVICKAIQC